MKNQIKSLKFMGAIVMLAGTIAILPSCAPVFSDLQSAKLVGPGNIEVTPSYSSVSFHAEGDSDKIQNHIGIQAATGVLDFMDFRARYERISLDGDCGGSSWVNILGFGPKFSLVRNYVSFYTPVGFAFGEDIKTADTWQIHPTLLLTLPVNQYFEFNTSGKVLIPFKSEQEITVAFNVGPAFSTNLEEWAIRPEIGFLYNPGEKGYFMHLSLGFTFFK